MTAQHFFSKREGGGCPVPWQNFDTLEQWPESLRESVMTLHLLALTPEALALAEAQITRAMVRAWRDAYYRERISIIVRMVLQRHPELPRRGVFRLVGHSLGKSESQVRDVFYAGEAQSQEVLHD